MAELLKANLVAHLSFYRRSRLLLAFLILFAALTALATVPQFFVDSGVQNFNKLQEILEPLISFSNYLPRDWACSSCRRTFAAVT
jgi:hypothetical protein